MRQCDILEPRMSPGGVILFDDIDFRKPGSGMSEAWRDLAGRPDVVAAVEVDGRLGIIEFTSQPRRVPVNEAPQKSTVASGYLRLDESDTPLGRQCSC